jgi:hypothetical protein
MYISHFFHFNNLVKQYGFYFLLLFIRPVTTVIYAFQFLANFFLMSICMSQHKCMAYFQDLYRLRDQPTGLHQILIQRGFSILAIFLRPHIIFTAKWSLLQFRLLGISSNFSGDCDWNVYDFFIPNCTIHSSHIRDWITFRTRFSPSNISIKRILMSANVFLIREVLPYYDCHWFVQKYRVQIISLKLIRRRYRKYELWN